MVGQQTDGGGDAALLPEQVDAGAGDAGERAGHVQLTDGGHGLVAVTGQFAGEQLTVGGGEGVLRQVGDSAVDAALGRQTADQVDIEARRVWAFPKAGSGVSIGRASSVDGGMDGTGGLGGGGLAGQHQGAAVVTHGGEVGGLGGAKQRVVVSALTDKAAQVVADGEDLEHGAAAMVAGVAAFGAALAAVERYVRVVGQLQQDSSSPVGR